MLTELFIKDWKWKFFTLLLAVLIWLTIHHNIQRETRTPTAAAFESTVTYGTIPVQLVSTRENVSSFAVAPATVAVKVGGSAENIDKLQASQIRALVGLSGLESAKDQFCPVDISMPPGITLISVEPSKVGILMPGKTP